MTQIDTMHDAKLPNISDDQTFSYMHNLQGPEEIMKLAVAASEEVRIYLSRCTHLKKDVLDQIRFETLILPFMFEARRLGDARGQVREK